MHSFSKKPKELHLCRETLAIFECIYMELSYCSYAVALSPASLVLCSNFVYHFELFDKIDVSNDPLDSAGLTVVLETPLSV